MGTNPVIEAIENRRSVHRFEATPIEEKMVEAILGAGRWAPSWINKQPWKFIVVTDPPLIKTLSELAPTVYKVAVSEAPVSIVVTADSKEDPLHYTEAGATATQNMALAAHSLGLGTCWIGVLGMPQEKKIQNALEIPKNYRVISILPIGVPKRVGGKDRRDLSQLVYSNKFGKPK